MMKVCYSEMDTPAGLSCRLEAAGRNNRGVFVVF